MGTFYYYQDKLGSTTHVANASGQLLESFHYDLYGTPTETSTHGIVDLYAGERWIPELGFYDLRNRFLSPELGRFLQTDPIGFKGDTSNLYRYCGNDPVDRSDPLGLEEFDNLPQAIRFARAQVIELSFGPTAHKEFIRDIPYGGPKTHGVGVGISKQGKKFVTSEPSYGEFKPRMVLDPLSGRLVVQRGADGKPVWYETEKYPDNAFVKIHAHNNKTGLATSDFSPLDRGAAKTAIVEKITEDDRRIERIGPSAKSPGYQRMNPNDPIDPSNYRTSSSGAGEGAYTASDVDARQGAAPSRGTGVPSLGAEAVNTVQAWNL